MAQRAREAPPGRRGTHRCGTGACFQPDARPRITCVIQHRLPLAPPPPPLVSGLLSRADPSVSRTGTTHARTHARTHTHTQARARTYVHGRGDRPRAAMSSVWAAVLMLSMSAVATGTAGERHGDNESVRIAVSSHLRNRAASVPPPIYLSVCLSRVCVCVYAFAHGPGPALTHVYTHRYIQIDR